jgi:hypothetical protein
MGEIIGFTIVSSDVRPSVARQSAITAEGRLAIAVLALLAIIFG